MTIMKKCKTCGIDKDTTQFSKCNSNKDGLQYSCKHCNSKSNLKFRTEINPTHHQKWQWKNTDKFNGYMRKYKKADKLGTVYAIINPLGETYVGMTQAFFKVRMIEHRNHYKKTFNDKRLRLPLLHESFDKYGMQNHKWVKLVEIDVDRETLHQIEKSFIKEYMQKNKSLNVRTW